VGFSVKTLTTVVGAAVGAGAAHFASSAVGANCGGVGVVIYSLRKARIDFDAKGQDVIRTASTGTTATTRKGTVAGRFTVNGRQLVIASTHGAEGVRAKKRGTACPEEVKEKELALERKRVEDFQTGLQLINELRQSAALEAAVLWGGDFNPRSVEPVGPRAGCPIWPGGLDPDADLENLQQGRWVLGSSEKLVTFASLLAGEDIEEVAGLQCPTYKKEKQTQEEDSTGAETPKQFRCLEDGTWMHYKVSHPPSWPDRIFQSVGQPWLKCGEVSRVAHISDHDALVSTCTVTPAENAAECGEVKEELEEKNARCCCSSEKDCRLLKDEELGASWKPWQWREKVCPSGLHMYTRFFEPDKFPEPCADALDGIESAQ